MRSLDEPLGPTASAPRGRARADYRISYWGRLESAELEEEYRLHSAESDLAQVKPLVGAIAIAQLWFAHSDYLLFGVTASFGVLLGARAAVTLLAVVFLVALRGAPSPRAFDKAVLIWSLVFLAQTLYVNYTRPPSYTGHAILDVLVVLLLYTASPVSVFYQATPAALFTIANLTLWILLKTPAEPLTFKAVTAGYFVAHVTGLLISRNLRHWRRRQFASLCSANLLREGLETALAEVKTLRGLIPMCAWCKRVRSDEGFWQQVEVYVSRHSYATFSHGMCPDCEQKADAEAGEPEPRGE